MNLIFIYSIKSFFAFLAYCLAGLVIFLTAFYAYAAEEPHVSTGFFEGTLGPTSAGVTGNFVMYVKPDLSSAYAIGTSSDFITNTLSYGFFDDNLPIVINSDPASSTNASSVKIDLNGIAGDGVSINLVANSGDHIGDLSYFTTSSGTSGFINANHSSRIIEQGSGLYSGTFTGNCDSGPKSGEIKAIVQKYSGSALSQINFFTSNTNGVKEGFERRFISNSTEFTFDLERTPSENLWSGTVDFISFTALGTWVNIPENCTGTWLMGLVDAPTEAQHFPNASSILPVARSIQVGQRANVFAMITNPYGVTDALQCNIVLNNDDILPVNFLYQTTDPVTNMLTGTVNTPVDIPPDTSQSFLISIEALAEVGETKLTFNFNCLNTDNERFEVPIMGLNTLNFVAETQPVPDILPIASISNLNLFPNLTVGFAVSAVEVGAGANITVVAEPTRETLLVNTLICETNLQGLCVSPPSAFVNIDTSINPSSTFAVFVTQVGTNSVVPGDRLLVKFMDNDGTLSGTLRGATSIALSTP